MSVMSGAESGGGVSRDVSDFGDGRYLSWSLSGHLQLRITRTAGPNAAVSGVFLD